MKEHIHAEMNNELATIARLYHSYGSLRELIVECTTRYIRKDRLWQENHTIDSNAGT